MLRNLSILLLLWLLLAHPAQSQSSDQPQVKVDLLSEVTQAKPTQSFRVGIRFQISPAWHIYWLNPGDSGLPPSVSWDSHPNIEWESIRWPYPIAFKSDSMENFGYEESVIALQSLHLKKSDKLKSITLTGHIEWLACRDVCIPGKQDVLLTLKVGKVAAVHPAHNPIIEKAETKMPVDLPYWYVKVLDRADHILLKVMPQKKLAPQTLNLIFFPLTAGLPKVSVQGKRHAGNFIEIKKSELYDNPEKILRGVLVSTPGFDDDNQTFALKIEQPIQ